MFRSSFTVPLTAIALLVSVACHAGEPTSLNYVGIVGEGKWGQFYHFTYTTFPKGTGTIVETFNPKLTETQTKALDELDAFLGKLGDRPVHAQDGQQRVAKSVTVPAGKAVSVANLTGPASVVLLRAQLALPTPPADRPADDRAQLRHRAVPAERPAAQQADRSRYGSSTARRSHADRPGNREEREVQGHAVWAGLR